MEMETLITAMKNSISEVLETMFFLPLDFPETDHWDLSTLKTEETLVSKLSFSGPFEGYFLFFIPQETASSLTADFLGKDVENISQSEVADTAKEIINMFAGSTFGKYDDQALFSLGIPQLMDLDDIRGDDPREGIFIPVSTLDNYLVLKIVTK